MATKPESNLWALKYKPNKLENLTGRDYFIKIIENISKSNDMPHLMFAGPKGFGKMTAAILVAKKILGDSYEANCKIVYASDPITAEERATVKKKSYVSKSKVGSMSGRSFTWPAFIFSRVKNFVELKPIGAKPFKILIIRDFHRLESDQQGFRRLMEKYSSSCRMILLTDEISSIIDPILSRCRIFFFNSPNINEFATEIGNIISQENLEIKGNPAKSLYIASNGRLGDSINILQKASLGSKIVTPDTIFKATGSLFVEEVDMILRRSLQGNLDLVNTSISLMLKKGYTYKEIIKELSDQIFNLPILESFKAGLLSLVSDIDFDSIDSSDDLIQINNLVYSLAIVFKKAKNMGI